MNICTRRTVESRQYRQHHSRRYGAPLRNPSGLAISPAIPNPSMRFTLPRYWLDRLRALPPARQRRLRAGLAVLAFIAVFAAGLGCGHWLALSGGDPARIRALAARNAALQHEHRTTEAANQALQQTLAERDQELQKLKADQVFYAKLISSDASQTGLAVHDIKLTQVANTRAWNFVATLTNTATDADTARGTMTISVEGVRDGKLAVADWNTLAGPAGKAGVPFAFRFFQQLRGTLMLPAGFVPNQIQVSLDPERGAAVTRKLAWNDAVHDPQGVLAVPP